MAGKKTTKTAVKAAPVKVLSDKEIVKKKFKSATCEPVKDGFCILDQVDEGSPVHAGIARKESDAWKLAAHAVL
jgi:hypothetical protein